MKFGECMEKVLTVSIAAYNMEGYLRQTLDSLCVPDTADDLEVLIIDDGSTDSTVVIAREYETRFPGTFKLISKANGGYGSTVNTAIKAATGKYFRLLDGDDWFNSDNLTAFINLLEMTDEDLVLSPFTTVYSSPPSKVLCGYGDVPDNSSFLFDTYADKLAPWMHTTTIKTKILQENRIHLPENRFYTDIEFILLPLPWCNTVRTTQLNLYCYRTGHAGQSVAMDSFVRHYEDHADLVKELLEMYNSSKSLSEERRRYLKRRIVELVDMHYNIHYFFKSKKVGKAKLHEFNTFLKANHSDIYAEEKKSPCKTQWIMQRTGYIGFYLVAWIKQKFRSG